MKTTVGSVTKGGRASAELLDISHEIFLTTTDINGKSTGAFLDIHSAYVLGMALMRHAKKAEERADWDQIGAAALELGEKQEQEERAGARCHGDLCAAGQIACPTPKACGVAV
jgi:hypothetical protein